MTTGHVYIATSLDGFVARKDHRLDWLMKQVTEGEEHGYEKFVSSVDGIVMGRGSYENVLSFEGEWPYAKPVVVMSKTLVTSDVPEALRERVEISTLDPVDLLENLSGRGWKRAYIDGGKVVQSFLREGLIEDLVLTTIPILIGDGIRLFGSLEQDVDLEVASSKSFPSGLLQTHYRVRFD